MQVKPHLFFAGRCEEALEFYARVLGAELTMLTRYKESPEPQTPDAMPAGYADKVMQASFSLGGTEFLASDGSGPKGFPLCLTPEDDATAQKVFQALAEGGRVLQALARTGFSSCFGMVTDRFGILWTVSVPSAAPASNPQEQYSFSN